MRIATGMSPSSTPAAAHRVNISLVRWFVVAWLLVSLTLLGFLGDEIAQHGPLEVFLAAAPPALPIVAIIWADAGPAIFYGSLTLLVAAAWLGAVQRPQSSARRITAHALLVVYWLLLWYPMALGA